MNSTIHYQRLYFERAQKLARIIGRVPYVQMVGLTGSVARRQATEQSDIDFFIVTQQGRIFTVRLLVTLLTQLMGVRRGKKIAGRICLNRYQTDNYLEIEPHSPYHAHDLSQCLPLYDQDLVYEQFVAANQWMKSYQIQFPTIVHQANEVNRWKRLWELILNTPLGTALEWAAKLGQTWFRGYNPHTRQFRDNIRFSDTCLAFHPPKQTNQT